MQCRICLYLNCGWFPCYLVLNLYLVSGVYFVDIIDFRSFIYLFICLCWYQINIIIDISNKKNIKLLVEISLLYIILYQRNLVPLFFFLNNPSFRSIIGQLCHLWGVWYDRWHHIKYLTVVMFTRQTELGIRNQNKSVAKFKIKK